MTLVGWLNGLSVPYEKYSTSKVHCIDPHEAFLINFVFWSSGTLWKNLMVEQIQTVLIQGRLFGKVGLWSSSLRRGFVAPSFCSNPLPLYVNSYPGFIWRPLFFTYFVVFHISPPLIVMAILNLISYTKCLKLFFLN